ncbi:hypothetical protein GUITHDRAFT_117731 [Guillardia theta CCMP2712]|uniref:MSP domain-containing protein n=1 Tax=Guillardia theta (strain CCMP2712) TaxID=905079 RepID=L1IJG0_GUITC|nr:hypothetical protein GUITHDRAFT_117731 [Guillardia theta CCMP2712]EKX36064.1 hypothetical protein GUITHDRAFT_117731 [Guillardia theta CCMP2712]|eukprot:XP_005823044.1 hypothetical protein GUITHDRAFT_117731 [Guillardia theta CCMP2712]
MRLVEAESTKIKTTSPMRYSVRPHCGSLARHEERVKAAVTIKLHFRLTASTLKLGDKFLLQTTSDVPEEEDVDVKKIFASLARDKITEKKISCKIKMTSDVELEGGEDANMDEHPQTVRMRHQSLQREYEEEMARNRGRLRAIEEMQKNLEEMRRSVEERSSSKDERLAQPQSERQSTVTLHLFVFAMGLSSSLWLLNMGDRFLFPLAQ